VIYSVQTLGNQHEYEHRYYRRKNVINKYPMRDETR